MPICKEKITKYDKDPGFTEISAEAAEKAMKSRRYSDAVSIYSRLASDRDAVGMREYAKILEAGVLVKKDISSAYCLYCRAAEAADAYSLFKCADKLCDGREKDILILISAALGAEAAYLPAAKICIDHSDERSAIYYLHKMVIAGSDEAARILAKGLFLGELGERSPESAKWYISKMKHKGHYFSRILRVLSKIEPTEPSIDLDTECKKILLRAIDMARDNDLSVIEVALRERLSWLGGPRDKYELAKRYISDSRQRPLALSLLDEAARGGVAEAHKLLGDIMLSEAPEISMEHYKRAALSEVSLYEMIADMYFEGKMIKKNIISAIEYYELAKKYGSEGARSKLRAIYTEREGLLLRGKALLKSGCSEAYSLLLASEQMGESGAICPLGICFELGIGVKKSTHAAFAKYALAHSEGDREATYRLGRCFSLGIGAAFSFNSARELFLLASRAGVSEADGELLILLERKKKHLIASLYSKGIRLIYNKKFIEAADALDLCARSGHGKAMYALGCLYEFGRLGRTDKDTASRLYSASRGAGFRTSNSSFKFKILNISR